MLRFFVAVFLLWSSQVFAVHHLVLVPGFFSSAVPAPVLGGNPWKQPYFSQDIIHYLASAPGNRVWVVDNLNPIGGVKENGENLMDFLRSHQKEMSGGPILLIAHSAGGLYSLYAAAHSDLPIDHIIAVSTPFQGLRFLQTLEDRHIPVDELISSFCLQSLLGLKPVAVNQFLTSLSFKRKLRLDVFAGYQQGALITADWRYLSKPLLPFQALIGEDSDGIVSTRSSLGVQTLQRNSNLNVVVHPKPIGLEHWELILDADISLAFGVLNIADLRGAQKWAYYRLLKESGY